jgi:hypothetical protein
LNYKGLKDKIYICKNCNQEFKFKGYSCNHIYCSTKCTHEYQRVKSKELEDKRFAAWVNNEPLDIVNPRPTLKIFITRLNGYKCAECGISEWNSKPITLWLDHKDGNAANNSRENLRLICPNCDSQSDTFGAKNYGKGRKSRGMKQYG